MTRARSILLFLFAVVIAAATTIGVVRVVIPPPAPKALPIPPPASSGLTKHVVFVVVDGLRYDVATDPDRMPIFARRMQEHASGEMWAGTVSMTSSAVLTYATGQRGGADQIINNETGKQVAYNNILDNVRAAGMKTAGTGDHAWFHMFRESWSQKHPDPEGVAIDVDYNAEIFGAAYSFIRDDEHRANLIVTHFVTPDHQAHAYGVLSERYRKHIREFDQKLDAFLRAIPNDTAVIITSDHGATDTGTHGSDTPVQRRSPFVAYGPGIVAARATHEPLDQVDVPSTIAALLGVPAPAHGRGHVIVDLLDAPDEQRAQIACADLERLSTYVSSIESGSPASTCSGATAREKITSAREAARSLDAALGDASLGGRAFAWLVPVLAFVATFALVVLTLSLFPTGVALGGAALMTAIAVALTLYVERLGGYGPTIGRVLLYVAGNALVLYAVLRTKAVADWFDRNPALGAVIFPGLLLVTPTRTTQIESFVLVAVIALMAIFGRLPLARASAERRWTIAGTMLLLLLLAPIAFRENGGILPIVIKYPVPSALLALVMLGAVRSRGEAPALTVVGIAIAAASLWFRRSAPPALCLAAWITLPIAGVLLLRGRTRILGELLLVSGYMWVSRDIDVPVLVAIIVLSDIVARSIGRQLGDDSPRALPLLAIVTYLFAITFLGRIGVENGIDFTQLDWGAGAFRDPTASVARIGVALVFKHVLARAAVIYVVFSAIAPSLRFTVARALVVSEGARACLLVIVLYVCGGSFWTALRVIGDLPHPLVALCVAAAALVAYAPRGLRAAAPQLVVE